MYTSSIIGVIDFPHLCNARGYMYDCIFRLLSINANILIIFKQYITEILKDEAIDSNSSISRYSRVYVWLRKIPKSAPLNGVFLWWYPERTLGQLCLNTENNEISLDQRSATSRPWSKSWHRWIKYWTVKIS